MAPVEYRTTGYTNRPCFKVGVFAVYIVGADARGSVLLHEFNNVFKDNILLYACGSVVAIFNTLFLVQIVFFLVRILAFCWKKHLVCGGVHGQSSTDVVSCIAKF